MHHRGCEQQVFVIVRVSHGTFVLGQEAGEPEAPDAVVDDRLARQLSGCYEACLGERSVRKAQVDRHEVTAEAEPRGGTVACRTRIASIRPSAHERPSQLVSVLAVSTSLSLERSRALSGNLLSNSHGAGGPPCQGVVGDAAVRRSRRG
jgi:hypothetical protein